jgi:hypothetical protein
MAKHDELGHTGHMRAFLGTEQGASNLMLLDPKGRPRLMLSVSDKGEPSLVLLDAKGEAVRTFDAHSK